MKHLWLALSPHGYGHAAMTAPVVAELRRRQPGLRVTIQTALPHDYLATRYDAFDHVAEIADFGFRMVSSIGIDLEASATAYRGLHADFPAVVAVEAARLRAGRPDLVLSNVAYVPLAAAGKAGIPCAALSSLNWADMYAHYLGDRPEAAAILADMHSAYGQTAVFLRCRPAQDMSLANLHDIGPVGYRGTNRRGEMAVGQGLRVGLIAFGGIDHDFPLAQWPELPGWLWLSALRATPRRSDMQPWRAGGIDSFADLVASVDVVVTKPGYGTFTEAGMAGTAVLYLPRPDWPESPHLDNWLAQHTRALPIAAEKLCGPDLPVLLQELFSLPVQTVAEPTGVAEAADILERLLSGEGGACERS